MAFWIFQNLVITTALAAVVAMVCRAGRIGPVARHALWVLVLVKFVTPPLVVWPWAAPDPFGISMIDASAVAGGREAPAQIAPFQNLPMTVGDAVMLRYPQEPQVSQNSRNLQSPQNLQNPQSPWSPQILAWLLVAWAAGSLGLLSLEGVRLARLIRRIRAATPADAAIVNRVAALSAQLGIRPVSVVCVADISSPAVWGWGRPRLLWPVALSLAEPHATDACIDGLLVHELAHVKRRDHLVGWLELAAGIVWWWNPLFWSVRSALREQAELACDAWVISALPNGRRAYAESLLTLSGAAVPASSPMAVIGVRATSRRVLERRLVMIMKGRAPLRLPFVGLFSLALVGAATLPAWATAQQAPPPPPPVPAVRPAEPPAPPTPATAPIPKPEPAPRARAVAVPQNPPPPPPPPPPATRARAAALPQEPPPPPPVPVTATRKAVPVFVQAKPTANWLVKVTRPPNLTAEGLQVLDRLEADQKAIQDEADRKREAARAAATKALQDLQERYTKEGKLDEAVVIRDYLRAGGPGETGYFRYFKR